MQEAMLNLRWDFFSSHLASTLDFCYEKQHFVDLSLVCKNNVTFKCHKMILSATSGFFRRLLTNNEHPHPLIILHDIDPEDLKAVLNFMYYGEIEVPESHVKSLVKVARVLDIAGLKDLQPSGQFSDSTAIRQPSGQFSDSSATRLGNSLPEIEEEIEVKKEPVSLEENGKPKIPLIKLQKPQVQKTCYNLRQRTGSLVRDSDFVVDSYKKNKRRKVAPEEKVSKPNQLGFKNGVKKVDDCNYFKKLKMLDEVEIIFQPQEVQGYDNSVFIKDEVDIDESQKRDKISLGPGVEIFKTFPWKPGTSRDFC
ncbi:uncharacterized protein LOC141532791 [Cotesia typhae]|uniref:uncharacterized protein LOC141532791 n=1 Tax=Cotesia typhae TaxID=2053667 RepID=UPI003D692A71